MHLEVALVSKASHLTTKNVRNHMKTLRHIWNPPAGSTVPLVAIMAVFLLSIAGGMAVIVMSGALCH